MHSSILAYVGIIVGGVLLLLKASERWWSAQEHQRFKEQVAALWLALSETKRHTLMRNFLTMIGSVIDQFYGEKVVSVRAFFRVQLTSAVIYFVALAVIGLRAGIPFSMENPPWQGFDYSFELAEKFFDLTLKTVKEQGATKTDEKEKNANAAAKQLIEEWSAKVKSYRTQEFRALHSALALACAVLLSGCGAFVGLAISRKLLRDLTILTTLTNAFAVITCAMLLFILLHGATIFSLTIIAIPITSAGAALIFGALWYLSFGLGVLLFFASVWILGIFAPLWIKVAGNVSALPVALLTIAAVGVILLTWLGWPLQRATVALLDRSLRSEKGPVVFFTSVIVSIAGLIGLFLSR